ncbi:MAG: DUF6483 family protein [Eubacteriales bacterium]|nr:DUF6483 family protein [Eubacteriales bacterium]
MSYQLRGVRKEIRDILRMTMILMTGAFQEKYQQPKFVENSAEETYFRKILTLLEEKNINEAENCLMEWIEMPELSQRNEVIQASMYFYQSVNELTDEQLEQADYSREEILEGIQFVLETVGVNTAKGVI